MEDSRQNKREEKIPVNYNEISKDINNSIEKTVSSITDYLSYKEGQITERARIEGLTKSIIESLKNERVKIQTLDKEFDERGINFNRYFNSLDLCIEKGEMEIASQILENIKILSSSSPLDKVDKMLSSGDKNTKFIANNNIQL